MRVILASMCLFFFFQAEDGIRDKLVTGVQTCALPIYSFRSASAHGKNGRRYQSLGALPAALAYRKPGGAGSNRPGCRAFLAGRAWARPRARGARRVWRPVALRDAAEIRKTLFRGQLRPALPPWPVTSFVRPAICLPPAAAGRAPPERQRGSQRAPSLSARLAGPVCRVGAPCTGTDSETWPPVRRPIRARCFP